MKNPRCFAQILRHIVYNVSSARDEVSLRQRALSAGVRFRFNGSNIFEIIVRIGIGKLF